MITRLRHLLSWRAHRYVAELVYTHLITHLPSNRLRLAYLRYIGVTAGPHTHISTECELIEPNNITFAGNTHVGRYTSFTAVDTITIGRNVSIAARVVLMTGDHDINSTDFRARTAPIVVQDRAWIATGATILKGVTIGEGAVISASAVIHKDVPPWTVWAGNPARQISTRSPEQTYELDFGGFRP